MKKKSKISGKNQENKEYLLCGAGKNPQISRVEKREKASRTRKTNQY